MLLLFFAQSLLASPALADDGPIASAGFRSETAIAQSTPSSEPKVSEPARDYRLGPEDVLSITVFGEAELSGSFTISEAGSLDFPLLGTLKISGASPQQVGELLTLELRDGYLHDPRVTVSVEVFSSQPVQVLGAVSEPGVYHLKGGTSVIQVLSEAGGIEKNLGATEVRVLREGREARPIILDVEALLEYGFGNMDLLAGDTIYVPKGPIVYVDGDVEKPGPVVFRKNMTATQALAEAGGALNTANLRDAYILREGVRISLNLRRIQKGRLPDVSLEPGDQIFLETSML